MTDEPLPSSRVWCGHGALLFATLTFSGWNVMAKAFDAEWPTVVLLSTVRDCTSFALLVVSSWWLAKVPSVSEFSLGQALSSAPAAAPERLGGFEDAFLVAVVGFAGPVLAPLATLLCVEWSGSDMAGIINATSPAMAGLMAVWFGMERCSRRLGAGLLAGVASGFVAAASNPSSGQQLGPSSSAGIVAGLVMAFSQALFFVAMKPLLRAPSSAESRQCCGKPWPQRRQRPLRGMQVVTMAYGLASVSWLCVACGSWAEGARIEASWGLEQSLLSIYAGTVCGALNWCLLAWAAEVLPVSVCALYGALQPPCTAILAYFLRGEALTLPGLLSMALAVASLVVLSVGDKGSEAAVAEVPQAA
ncbi:unnamed protein product [Polarella glacialis]|uniref:EamA domain-containing protein n=2 Tax=Polarella glacialis TaxID=89957 RepID=A0A813LIU9_POLGL|nr:unnamed protein product [Polarella glacialis]